MRYLFCLLATALTTFAAAPTVNILPAPIQVIPVTQTEIAISQVTLGTNNSLALIPGAIDFSGILQSQLGTVINDIQRIRFTALLDSYKQSAHIIPIPQPSGSTNPPIWRMSSPAGTLWQVLERIELQNISVALIAPPTNAPVPLTNTVPIIIIPGGINDEPNAPAP